MKKNVHSPPSDRYNYFGAQASWGVTKHLGGRNATDALVDMCDLERGKHVLDVGCGVGMTSCYLANRFKCRVTGLDQSSNMLEWANRRKRRHKLEDLVNFKSGDITQLPFEDGYFDSVICESVLVFVEDKRQAVKELSRVVRAGGHIGINEGTWLRSHPPEELVSYLHKTMAGARFLDEAAWQSLITNAGITELTVRVNSLQWGRSGISELRTMDLSDLLARFQAFGTLLKYWTVDPKFRAYTKSITPNRGVMSDLIKFLGYGLYAGRKPPDWV